MIHYTVSIDIQASRFTNCLTFHELFWFSGRNLWLFAILYNTEIQTSGCSLQCGVKIGDRDCEKTSSSVMSVSHSFRHIGVSYLLASATILNQLLPKTCLIRCGATFYIKLLFVCAVFSTSKSIEFQFFYLFQLVLSSKEEWCVSTIFSLIRESSLYDLLLSFQTSVF